MDKFRKFRLKLVGYFAKLMFVEIEPSQRYWNLMFPRK